MEKKTKAYVHRNFPRTRYEIRSKPVSKKKTTTAVSASNILTKENELLRRNNENKKLLTRCFDPSETGFPAICFMSSENK